MESVQNEEQGPGWMKLIIRPTWVALTLFPRVIGELLDELDDCNLFL